MKDWDEIKWELRRKEKEALQNRWLQEDLREAEREVKQREFEAQLRYEQPGLFQTDINSLSSLNDLREQQRAKEIKWELRQKEMQDLENRWLQEDLREAEKEAQQRKLEAQLRYQYPDLFK